MTTIVFSHPWQGSFNKGILDQVTRSLDELKQPYQLIDLYKDGFNPVMAQPDLALFSQGKYADPMVGKYQEMLAKTDELIFVFPIWWFNTPAMIKGFIDKVMLRGFAYEQGASGLTGLLTNIRHALVLTTSNSATEVIRDAMGNPIEGVFIKGELMQVGVQSAEWMNCSDTQPGKDRERACHLAAVARRLQQLY